MPVITPVLGDITTQDVDAIVNPANKAMRGGSGVDGAIHRSGGPAILSDCIARFPNGLAAGDAGWTTAGDLPARWVIHTVGPNYNAGQRDRSVLVSCYRRALEVADEVGARTIAFPLISTGVRGWPRADAIAAAIETIAAAETRVDEVRLVAFDEAMHKRTRAAVWVRCPAPVGKDTVGSLFEREPIQYSLRGDFYLWRELRARFADTPLPDDWFPLRTLILNTIEQVVGEPLTSRRSALWHDHAGAIYVPEFDPGHGMSAGAVHVPWWVHTGVPILLDRYAAVRESNAFQAD
ncbi:MULTISPECIES: macro domain-containing protein [unclassified Micromonospora]|uniref:macro domain-containing protein n=1 Tax=unclassified Micromonospora TaxID=2617518 RepID=UPI00332B56A0